MAKQMNDFDYIMKSPEGLLNVRIEVTTIRDILLDLNSKIENVNKKMIEFLKSREINELQTQIDKINKKIDSLELQASQSTPENVSAEPVNFNTESIERKIEENKFLLDQSLRNFVKKSIDELKANFENSLSDIKDQNEVNNAKKYATIDMIDDLQLQIEEFDSKLMSVNVKPKKSPPTEMLSSRILSARTSGSNSNTNPNSSEPSPPNSASQGARINRIATKVSTLDSTLDAMKGITDDMKKKINETEKNCLNNTENMKSIEEKVEFLHKLLNDLQNKESQGSLSKEEREIKQFTHPETIIKTVPQEIDLDGLKFEIVQSVLDQVLPYLEENFESMENVQNTQQPQNDNKNPLTNLQTISEDEPEVVDEKPKEEPKQEAKQEVKQETKEISQPKKTTTEKRPLRDFSSLMANKAGSPRSTKPAISDPRVSAIDMQLKSLKNSVGALEKAMKSQFGLFDSRITELLLRTASIEKCIEEKGDKIEKIDLSELQVNCPVDSIGCQTVDDDVGTFVDLDEKENKNQVEAKEPESENQEESKNQENIKANEEQSTPSASDTVNDSQTNENKNQTNENKSQTTENKNQTNENNSQNSEIDSKPEKIEFKEIIEKPNNEAELAKVPPINKTIIKPIISQRPSTVPGRAGSVSSPTLPRSNNSDVKKEDLQLYFGTITNPISSSRGRGISSRSNLSSRSHVTSQTYEDLDKLTKNLDEKVKELIKQMSNATERLGEEDRQIHQIKKSLDVHVTKDDLEELRSELAERNSFNRKTNPNSESVTALQLKRVVGNFQNSMKAVDKQLENINEKVMNFVSKDDLTSLVEAITQMALSQNKEKMTSTAGGSMAYKCLLCGRPTNQVTGMITESEVARLIGEPPIIGASAQRGVVDSDGNAVPTGGNDLVLMYGKEGSVYRSSSQMSSKRKKITALPRIAPKTPNVSNSINNNNES